MRQETGNWIKRYRHRQQLAEARKRKRAREKRKGLPAPNELDNAWQMLSDEQREAVQAAHRRGESISAIACRLKLTRSAVQSYVRRLNRPPSRTMTTIP